MKSAFFSIAAIFLMLTRIYNQMLKKCLENMTTKPIFLVTHILIAIEFEMGMMKRACRQRKAQHN